MLARLKTLALVAVVAGGVLVPLFGDPRHSPVTHPEWARLVLRALDVDRALELTPTAAEAFAVLSWRNALVHPADQYVRGTGVVVEALGDTRRLVAQPEGTGEAVYAVAVVRGGDYHVRLRLSGDPEVPARAELARVDGSRPRDFTVTAEPALGWVAAGTTHLWPGAYHLSVQLPPGSVLERVEVGPSCIRSVEPFGGWKPAAVALTDDVAVTALQAVDLEHELPPADTPVEIPAADFQHDETFPPGTDEPPGSWARGGARGAKLTVFLDLPEDGVYSFWVYGVKGGGMSWLADHCLRSIVCGWPDPQQALADQESRWLRLVTSEFRGGRHHFSVVLGPGSAVSRVKLERKKASPADYLATVRRLGLDPGPDGSVVTRPRAVEAMEWIRGHRPDDLVTGGCEVVREPEARAAGAGEMAPVQGPGAAPPGTGTPPGPGGPLPPLPNPEPSPSPGPKPSPTLPPPPSPQPPASATVPYPLPSPLR